MAAVVGGVHGGEDQASPQNHQAQKDWPASAEEGREKNPNLRSHQKGDDDQMQRAAAGQAWQGANQSWECVQMIFISSLARL